MTHHDVTKWTMDDVYGQHIHVHLLTIYTTFAIKSILQLSNIHTLFITCRILK
jgi:hypothetical protein